jgi:hypothetical protein
MRTQSLFPIALSVVLSLLVMACKDSPTSPNTTSSTDASALKATWIMETLDGQNALAEGSIWTFGDGTASYSDARIGCWTSMTYTVSGSKITSTLTHNSCGQDPVGTRGEMTWSITNGKLTLTSDGSTMVFHKVAGAERAIGSWEVTSIDGSPLLQGAAMSIFVYGDLFEIQKIKPGENPCLTRFASVNTGSALNVQVISDECGDVQVGATDTFNWTTSGNTITFRLASTGTTIEATRW